MDTWGCPVSVDRLRTYLAGTNLKAFLVMRPENVRYLSGFTGGDSSLLVTRERNLFLTDPRYIEQAGQECPGWEIVNWREAGVSLPEAIVALIKKEGSPAVAFEADYLTVKAHEAIATGGGLELVPTTGVIEEFRKIKTPEEIEKLRKSCAIADRALARLLEVLRPGVTEKEMAAELALYLVKEGSDPQPYGGILISGKRCSLLHGIPSDKVLEKGDFVLMDFGGAYKGYLADMTRTVVLGKATEEQKEVYALERSMFESALGKMRAGSTAVEVFEASIKPLEGSRYMGYHYTGIGHGIGLFVHELPFLGPRSKDVLAENMVMTLEPGIYIPGWGGVRIEDQVLITKDGIIDFTSSTRDLVEL